MLCNMQDLLNTSFSTRNLVGQMLQSDSGSNTRSANTVFADPAKAETYLQRNSSSSQLILTNPLDDINTSLSNRS